MPSAVSLAVADADVGQRTGRASHSRSAERFVALTCQGSSTLVFVTFICFGESKQFWGIILCFVRL